VDYLRIGTLLVAISSLTLTIFLWKRLEKSTLSKLIGIRHELENGLDSINEDLKPITNASSRAMGAISSLSDDTKQDKAIERRMGQDLIAQNEDVVEVIRMAFPRVSEYIDEHPEAVTKIMPRLNALLSDPEARKRLNLGSFSTTSDLSKIWKE